MAPLAVPAATFSDRAASIDHAQITGFVGAIKRVESLPPDAGSELVGLHPNASLCPSYRSVPDGACLSHSNCGGAMPLVSCRECGKEVSTQALACPRCGLPAPVGGSTQPSRSISAARFRSGNGGLIVVLGLVLVAVAGILGLPSQGGDSSATNLATNSSRLSAAPGLSTDSAARQPPRDFAARIRERDSARARMFGLAHRTSGERIPSLSTAQIDSAYDALTTAPMPDSAMSRWLAALDRERHARMEHEAAEGLVSGALAAASKECGLSKARAVRVASRHPDWSASDVAAVACHYVEVGMTEEQLIASWGRPTHINRSVYSTGESDQWVYNENSYVYFENGVVTSFQLSH